jgi:pimeloyl-ACP methyl ester carboxylesterase
MDERFEIATSLGEVWMWGRDTGKPIVLLITGAFADFDVYDRLPLVLPQFDVLRTHLPGNHSPVLIDTSIGVMAGAISQAMTARFGGRPLVILGLSTGAGGDGGRDAGPDGAVAGGAVPQDPARLAISADGRTPPRAGAARIPLEGPGRPRG